MTRPLLSLVVMVKDEERAIRATLESAKPFVDRFTILDTGSTDRTKEVALSVMEGLPGKIYEEPFVDYSTSRNRALDLDAHSSGGAVEGAVFTLMLSADETLHGGQELRAFLEEHRAGKCGKTDCICAIGTEDNGAYCVTMQERTQVWPYSRVLRADAKWRYEGVVQEQPVSPSGQSNAPVVIPGVTVVHAESDPARKEKRLREYDLPKLTKFVEDESKPLIDRVRGMYYLAETHANLGSLSPDVLGSARLTHFMTAMSHYWRYAILVENEIVNKQGNDKAFFGAMRAYFMYYHIGQKVGLYEPVELELRLKPLVEAAPRLVEARYMLAQCAAQVDPRRGIFLALKAAEVAKEVASGQVRDEYYETRDTRVEWLSLKLAAECAEAMKDHERAVRIAKYAIAAGCPEEMIKFEEAPKKEPVRSNGETSRNAPCPCGSGKKYKLCCLPMKEHRS